MNRSKITDPITGRVYTLINRVIDYTIDQNLMKHYINKILVENEEYYRIINGSRATDGMFFKFTQVSLGKGNVREGTPVTDMHDSDLPSP